MCGSIQRIIWQWPGQRTLAVNMSAREDYGAGSQARNTCQSETLGLQAAIQREVSTVGAAAVQMFGYTMRYADGCKMWLRLLRRSGMASGA
jgi:hypothetical protein